MIEVEITLEKLLPIWWAFIWRFLVVSMLLGFVLGFIGGFVVALAGAAQLARPVGGVLGWLASIPVSLWAMKSALSKTYGGLTLRLIRH